MREAGAQMNIKELSHFFGISLNSAKNLCDLGFKDLEDFNNVHIPYLMDNGISYSLSKKIVEKLVQNGIPFTYDKPDDSWVSQKWEQLVRDLVVTGIVTWEEVAICVLGELNPPQVGTSTASNCNIKARYPKRECMKAVMDWFYNQPGKCANCGTRLHLEADHIEPKEQYLREAKEIADADRLENLQLLCKRCNVIRRESHALGGLSFQTAQAALMWILFYHRPSTIGEYEKLCRRYGLTMASVRFQEGWAMKVWLERDGLY